MTNPDPNRADSSPWSHGGLIRSMRIHAPSQWRNLAVVPLTGSAETAEHPLPYLRLSEAMSRDGFRITEVNRAGIATKALVTNHLDEPVLLLDGEDLHGGKQNRTINATTLIAPNSEETIQVSGVERRWTNPDSEAFTDTGTISASLLRRKKSFRVLESLMKGTGFRSFQDETQADAEEFLHLAGTAADPGPLLPAGDGGSGLLEEYVSGIQDVPGQTGFIALVGGRLAGMEWFQDTRDYAHYRERLLASYACEAILDATPEPDPDDRQRCSARYRKNAPSDERSVLEKIARFRRRMACLQATRDALDKLAATDEEDNRDMDRLRSDAGRLHQSLEREIHFIRSSWIPELERLHRQLSQARLQHGAKRTADSAPPGGALEEAAILLAAGNFLSRTARAHPQFHETPGWGKDCRLTTERSHGSALVFGDTALHLSIFPTRDGEFLRERRVF